MDKKKVVKKIFFILFLISLLYYVGWLIYAIRLSFVGIDSGWAMPAMSNHEMDYGFDAFASGIAIAILWTWMYAWCIPLLQGIYLIVTGILAIVRKVQKKG